MALTTAQPLPILDRLRDAAWLRAPGIRTVFAALATTGGTSRAVGGAVRNTLLGEAIADIDIATTATPEQVLAAAARAGLTAIPTGLQHGTVTLLAGGKTYEVTTLRRDVATDGRHATVAFTDDWAADAGRRDFTINALYCDPDAGLFDPLGGAADLSPVRIRFIGDADRRIEEDYLRILRFFRFSARYGVGTPDAVGLAACGRGRAGLARISAERIRDEALKLLATDRAAEMVRVMQAHGFLVGVLGLAPAPGRLQRCLDLESALGRAGDPIRRLAALAVAAETDAAGLARRLKLSGRERQRLATIAATLGGLTRAPDAPATRRFTYAHGTELARECLLAGWVASGAPVDDGAWRAALQLAETWVVQRLPVGGADVLASGLAAGPDIGRLLAAVESWWQDRDFAPDRAACLEALQQLARSSRA